MNPAWYPIISVLIAAAFPAIATVLGKKGDTANAIIDQLQEEVKTARSDASEAKTAVADMQRELHTLQEKLLQYANREFLWRWHTEQQNGMLATHGLHPLELPSALREES